MQRTATRFSIFLTAILAGAWALAQAPVPQAPVAPPINIRRVEFSSVRTPNYEVHVRNKNLRRDGRMDWLMVSSDFDTTAPWMDEITFTFFVMLEARTADLPPGAPTRNMFTGTVTYMNVKRGRHEANMFLDHNTFERYGRPVAVAVVATVGGQPAGVASSPASPWWNTQTPIGIPLVRRDQSPFIFVNIEGHLTIKP